METPVSQGIRTSAGLRCSGGKISTKGSQIDITKEFLNAVTGNLNTGTDFIVEKFRSLKPHLILQHWNWESFYMIRALDYLRQCQQLR